MTTLGPWEACGNLIRTKREANGSGGFLVAEVPANTGNTSEKAALMAAAPDLRNALQRLLDEIDVPEANCSCHVAPPCGDCVEHADLREAVEVARAALAKATGSQP